MAKCKLTYTHDLEYDGVDIEVTYTQSNVDDVQGMVNFFSEAIRAAGYTYVANIIAVKDDLSEVNSTF